jgi:hypothetical protein
MSGNSEISPLRFHDFNRSEGTPQWGTSAKPKTLAELVFGYDFDDVGGASEQQQCADQQERAVFDLSQDLLSKCMRAKPQPEGKRPARALSAGDILRLRGRNLNRFEVPYEDIVSAPWAYGLPGSGEKRSAQIKVVRFPQPRKLFRLTRPISRTRVVNASVSIRNARDS